ncbi:ABC transporter ATP-binding protein [Sinomonas halotolerans]|uniref:ABC transporter ATP-binding protein n=1 Tax=Sinomonas halotolerans TaxID=1644133 RepID=A0ABU9WXR3_9MICC
MSPTRGQEPRTPLPGFPGFFTAGRRGLLVVLIGTGTAIALLSAATAWLVSLLSSTPDSGQRVLLVVGLLGLVGAAAGLRILERVLAERLGQSYVHEIRLGLLRGALAPGRGPSLGITVARTSNDLNSVRNWVVLGIAAAASGLPLVLVLTASLWLMAPPLAVAVMVPLLAATALLAWLSGPTRARAGALRKARGRLAGQVTDTVNAATAIRAGAGEDRELGRIDALGRDVAGAAVRRAVLAGSLRASAAAAASATAVSAAATGAFMGLDPGLIAAALTVVSLTATPVHDLGRIVEYRQSYLAARAAILPGLAAAPVLLRSGTPDQPPAGPPRAAAEPRTKEPEGMGTVEPEGLRTVEFDLGGVRAAPLRAVPGQCVHVTAADHTAIDELFSALLDGRAAPFVWIDGIRLSEMDGRLRRRSLGYAARALALERGRLGRALRYRRPGASDAEVADAVHRAGMAPAVARLPRGLGTVLRRGGDPLGAHERAKAHLVRAVLGTPPLLLVNRLDADLDDAGRAALRRVLEEHPGVQIVATDRPEILPDNFIEWRLDNGDALS